jgi:peptidyl-prolyl cis-trans isomerase B (cyclophilin B)
MAYFNYHVTFIVNYWNQTLMKIFFRYLAPLLLAVLSFSTHAEGGNVLPQVKLETNYGVIVIELNSEKAPNTVANFLSYVNDGFYDGTIFHRVIKDFMVQGGGFTEEFVQKTPKAPIQNEANNGLSNVRGSLAMARTGDPHSATAQFFINTVDNNFLDFRGVRGAMLFLVKLSKVWMLLMPSVKSVLALKMAMAMYQTKSS